MPLVAMTEAVSHGLAPKVEADELRDCWESSRDFAAKHPGAGWGGTPQYSFSVIYRAAMLQMLLMDASNPLASWRRGDDLMTLFLELPQNFR